MNRTVSKKLFMITLTMMSMAGLVGSDIYLPTLPAVAKFYATNMHAVQLTMSLYLYGLAVGQLFIGYLSDRISRKTMLLSGMALYGIASILCAAAPVLWVLYVARFLQAIGACAGLVIGRSIVGDKYSKQEAGKIFSTIFPFVGMSPAIAPVIGGFIGYAFGWRYNFILIALFALVIILLIVKVIQDDEKTHSKQHSDKLLAMTTQVLTQKSFLFYASAPCFAYIAYFAYIAQTPFIFHHYGFNAKEIGFFYLTLSLTYVLANILGRKLLSKKTLDRTLMLGYIPFVMGGCLLFLSGYCQHALIFMVVAISVLTFGNGFLIPLGMAGVMGIPTQYKGIMSGMLGFLQLSVAALSSAAIGYVSHNSITIMGLYIFIVTVLALVIHVVLKK